MDVKARVSSGDELLNNEKFKIPSIIMTPNPLDFNTFTTPGIYYVGSRYSNGASNNFLHNGPIEDWGTLFVSGEGGTLFQVFISDTQTKIFHRHRNTNEWTNWVNMIDVNYSRYEDALLNKAYPVGFSYLSIDKDSKLPKVGSWGISIWGYICPTFGGTSCTRPVYKIIRSG